MKKLVIIFAILFASNAWAVTTEKANFAFGTLATAITDGQAGGTTFTVTPGTTSGSFPSSSTFLVVVFSSSCANPTACAAREIISISSNSSNIFTISARNQESTTHTGDWAIGSKVWHPFTAGMFSEYAALIDPTFTNDINVAGNAVVTGTVTGKLNVVNYTTSQDPLSVASRSIVTNTGASGTLTHVLPACTGDGTVIGFWLTATQALQIDPDGTDQIIRLTDSAGDSITSDTVIDTNITLMCIENAKWHAAEDGTWTDTD